VLAKNAEVTAMSLAGPDTEEAEGRRQARGWVVAEVAGHEGGFIVLGTVVCGLIKKRQ